MGFTMALALCLLLYWARTGTAGAGQIPFTPSSFQGTPERSAGHIVDEYAPALGPLETVYKDIHQHPELSRLEARTASVVAGQLRKLGLDVYEGIGGHGVVGVFRNGPGKTVLLRAELDALPIQEATGLAYASERTMKDWWGREQPVMHACGHDMHMACLLAATQLLVRARAEWTGTLVSVFQPNEEHTGGARAMVDDGLYADPARIPVPDAVLAQHQSLLASGTVSVRGGPVLVSADTVRVRLYASEGHAANPQVAVDVVVVASKALLALQAVVGAVNKRDKTGYASIAVQEIHAGTPGEDWLRHVDLVLDVKTYSPATRKRLHAAIRRTMAEAAAAAGTAQAPDIETTERAPLTSNDEALAAQVHAVFSQYFGPDKILDAVPSHPCEDVSVLATAVGAPYVFWFLGRVDPQALDDARRRGTVLDDIPISHSPFNALPVQTTLEAGMKALSLAALGVYWNGSTGGKE